MKLRKDEHIFRVRTAYDLFGDPNADISLEKERRLIGSELVRFVSYAGGVNLLPCPPSSKTRIQHLQLSSFNSKVVDEARG